MKAKILIPIILCLAMTPAINAEKQTTQTPSHNKNKTSNIRNGLILIIGKGKNKYGQDGAHIWVLDGVKNFVVTHTCFYRKNGSANWEVMSQSKHKYHFNHFNWGWGGSCDGWFNDMVFNSDNPIDYSYFNQGYVKEGMNFTRNIKYFTVDL